MEPISDGLADLLVTLWLVHGEIEHEETGIVLRNNGDRGMLVILPDKHPRQEWRKLARPIENALEDRGYVFETSHRWSDYREYRYFSNPEK